jgi:hypothetical protein
MVNSARPISTSKKRMATPHSNNVLGGTVQPLKRSAHRR